MLGGRARQARSRPTEDAQERSVEGGGERKAGGPSRPRHDRKARPHRTALRRQTNLGIAVHVGGARCQRAPAGAGLPAVSKGGKWRKREQGGGRGDEGALRKRQSANPPPSDREEKAVSRVNHQLRWSVGDTVKCTCLRGCVRECSGDLPREARGEEGEERGRRKRKRLRSASSSLPPFLLLSSPSGQWRAEEGRD